MSFQGLPQEAKQHVAKYLTNRGVRNLSLAGKSMYVDPTYDQCCMRFSELDAAKLMFSIPDLKTVIDDQSHDSLFSRRQIGGKTVFLYLPWAQQNIQNNQNVDKRDVNDVEIIETPNQLVKAWYKSREKDQSIFVPRELVYIDLMRCIIPILKRRKNCNMPGWVFKCWKSILKDWIAKYADGLYEVAVLVSIYDNLLNTEGQLKLEETLNGLLGPDYVAAYMDFRWTLSDDEFKDYNSPILAMWEIFNEYRLNPIPLVNILRFVDMITEEDVKPEFFKI